MEATFLLHVCASNSNAMTVMEGKKKGTRCETGGDQSTMREPWWLLYLRAEKAAGTV